MGLLSDFFKPAPKTRVRDVLREIPKATLKVGKAVGGAIGSIGKSAIEDLIVQPSVRAAQSGIALLGGEKGKKFAEKDIEVKVPVLGKFQITKQKAGGEGGAQIAGQALKQASWLYTPGGGKAAATAPTFTRAVLQGAKTGAFGLGSYTAGEAMQAEKPTLTSVLKETLKGVGMGAIGGAAFGALGYGLKKNPKITFGKKEAGLDIKGDDKLQRMRISNTNAFTPEGAKVKDTFLEDRFVQERARGFLGENKSVQQQALAKNALTTTNNRDIALMTEAKKYKTAEDFINNQGKIKVDYDWSYLDQMKAAKAQGKRYSKSDFRELLTLEADKRNLSETFYRTGRVDKAGDIWFTNDEWGAKSYAGEGDITKEYRILTQNPLDVRNSEALKKIVGDTSEEGFGNNPTLKQKVIDYAKKHGYDSVFLPDTSAGGVSSIDSLVVWDKKLIKTKSQLATIYNRVTGNGGLAPKTLIPKSGSVEAVGEKAGRWKAGVKSQFDEALMNKDTQAVKALLPQVPAVYKQRFVKNIDAVLKTESQAGFVKLPDKGEITEGMLSVKSQLYDSLAAVKNLDDKAYQEARLFAGNAGRIQNRLDELASILRPGKNILGDMTKYAILERELELANRGITKFQGGRTIAQIKAEKAAMDASPKAVEIRTFADQIRGYTDKLLGELKDAGILSKESFAFIQKNNQKYIPFQRMAEVADNFDNIPSGSKSFSVASQDVIKTLKGSVKEIVNPIESIVKNTYKIETLIGRNRVAQKVADLAGKKGFENTVMKVTEEVPVGMEKISVFRNGVKEEYAVPKMVGEALKGLNQEQADILTRAVRAVSTAPLRAGATSLNVAFLPTNAIRDLQTATIVSKVGFTPWDWVKGLSSAIKQDKYFKLWRESGGAQAGFFERNKSLAATTKKLTEGKISKTVKAVANPLRLFGLADVIRKGGEIIEEAPRIGVFRRALQKGVEPRSAAFASREATVDFAKSGSALKIVNQWVPFLNARLQGSVNLLKAVKNRPSSSALKIGALIGMPTLATYLHNSRNHSEAWNDIAQFEKDQNFIIIYGDKKDEDGRYTQIVKIPKGDAGRVFANPLENFLAYLDKKQRKAVDELALAIASDISPVDFEKEGRLSGGAFASGALPPLAKAVTEWVTNKNLFTGFPIVPQSMEKASPKEQYKASTSPVTRFLGQKTNLSPLKLENTAGTMFGGLGRQLINPFKASSTVTRRFTGARGGQSEQKWIKEAEKLVTEQTDEKIKLHREAERIIRQLEKSDDPATEFDALAKENPSVAKKVAEIKKQQDLDYSDLDYTINELGVENGQRAKFIFQYLKEQPDDTARAKLWDELIAKELISKKVAEQLNDLMIK